MKPEEAIEVLSNELIVITDMIGYCRDFEKESDLALAYRVKRQDAYKIAISALKELQQYREIGTVEECREAVEKQKAKYIKIESYCPAYCPTCRFELSESLGDGYYEYFVNLSRCPKCGQKICWDEDLEGMEDEIMQDCGIMCYLALDEAKEN